MGDPGPHVRLRQAVLVAAALEPVCGELTAALGLGEPFHDPGVGQFGIENAVYAIGDCFLEVIAPVQEGTAAGRYLDRQGPGGYMALFDLEDLASARERVERLGIRVVWRIDLPDIAGTHLHPSDMGGAIVSLDRSHPYGSWRWGGPQWTARTGEEGAPGALRGITLALPDPQAVAARWAEVLGVAVTDGAQRFELALDGGRVCMREPDAGAKAGLVEFEIERAPETPAPAGTIELGGMRLRIVEQ